MMGRLRDALADQSDLILVIGMIAVLGILFVPIPSGLLDFLLVTNFSFALLILLLTFYVQKPLEFSTFPSILLIATLFRLSLNIAATRLILGDADAGQVIDAVGEYVVAGNYVIGMIVFLVLIVVQYVVVTNGAQRVAEVSARFTLDGMPGKQMSIDADLNMGLLDEREAQARRQEVERQANFYGAMDGASKFVKGDAIAGIIIILIDIVGGLTIGVAQLGMGWGSALERYTLLTIGDGIVTQIPALVISVGTGIIVTRATSDEFLSRAVSGQVTAYPKILVLVGIMLFALMVLPGIPALPVAIVLAAVAVIAFYAFRKRAQSDAETEDDAAADGESGDDIYAEMAVEPLELAVGTDLAAMVNGESSTFMDRIVAFRRQYALEMGLVIPRVRVREQARLAPTRYEILVDGVRSGEGDASPGRLLAIQINPSAALPDGEETRDPTYGLPATWIEMDREDSARSAGHTVVDCPTVLTTHLTETIRRHAPDLLSRSETDRLLDRVRETNAGLVDELVPSILAVTDVQRVLQALLRERVSIRNLQAILETLVDRGRQEKDPEALAEAVRGQLAGSICQDLLSEEGELKVMVFDPGVERTLAGGLSQEGSRGRLALEPRVTEQLISRIATQAEKMMRANLNPVLLCAPELRRQVRRVTERGIPNLAVLSMSEVPGSVQVRSFGLVSLQSAATA